MLELSSTWGGGGGRVDFQHASACGQRSGDMFERLLQPSGRGGVFQHGEGGAFLGSLPDR
jgi:hypothetical protein